MFNRTRLTRTEQPLSNQEFDKVVKHDCGMPSILLTDSWLGECLHCAHRYEGFEYRDYLNELWVDTNDPDFIDSNDIESFQAGIDEYIELAMEGLDVEQAIKIMTNAMYGKEASKAK